MKSLFFILITLPFFSFGKAHFERKRDSLYAIAINPHLSDLIRANSYTQLCTLYSELNPDSTIQVCERSFTFIREARSKNANSNELKELEANVLTYAGLAFDQLNNFNRSISLLNKAIVLEKDLNNQNEQARILYLIGDIQKENKYLNEALSTYTKASKIEANRDNKQELAHTYTIIGNIHLELQNDSLALLTFAKSLEIYTELESPIGIATSKNNIGLALIETEQYKLAIQNLEQSAEICNNEDYAKGQINALHNLAEAHYGIRSYKKGLKIAIQAKELAIQSDNIYALMHITNTISKIRAAQRYYKRALNSHEAYTNILDSLHKTEYAALENTFTAYKTNQYTTNDTREKNRQKTISKLKYQAENNTKTGISTNQIIIAILILLFLLFSRSRQIRLKKEQEEIVKKQKAELELKTLRSQTNPQFLFNRLSSIKQYIIKNKPEEAANYLSSYAKLVSAILDNSNQNYIKLSEEINCLSDYVEFEQLRFPGTINFEINSALNLSNYSVPPSLLHTFIENSIWHGIANKEDKSGNIKINIIDIAEGIRIEIIDDGIGREKAKEIEEENSFMQKTMGLIDQEQAQLSKLYNKTGFKHQVFYSDLYNRDNENTGTKIIITLPQQS